MFPYQKLLSTRLKSVQRSQTENFPDPGCHYLKPCHYKHSSRQVKEREWGPFCPWGFLNNICIGMSHCMQQKRDHPAMHVCMVWLLMFALAGLQYNVLGNGHTGHMGVSSDTVCAKHRFSTAVIHAAALMLLQLMLRRFSKPHPMYNIYIYKVPVICRPCENCTQNTTSSHHSCGMELLVTVNSGEPWWPGTWAGQRCQGWIQELLKWRGGGWPIIKARSTKWGVVGCTPWKLSVKWGGNHGPNLHGKVHDTKIVQFYLLITLLVHLFVFFVGGGLPVAERMHTSLHLHLDFSCLWGLLVVHPVQRMASGLPFAKEVKVSLAASHHWSYITHIRQKCRILWILFMVTHWRASWRPFYGGGGLPLTKKWLLTLKVVFFKCPSPSSDHLYSPSKLQKAPDTGHFYLCNIRCLDSSSNVHRPHCFTASCALKTSPLRVLFAAGFKSEQVAA